MKNLLLRIKNFIVKNRYLTILILVCLAAVIAITPVIVILSQQSAELTKIEIASEPFKTQYIEEQKLKTDGLVVKAYYGSRSVEVNDYTVDKTELKLGDTSVTVSYTHGSVTKTASFEITVSAKKLVSIEITQAPHKLTYIENTAFDPTGLIVTAVYDNGQTVAVTGYSYDKMGLLKVTDSAVTVTYSENGIECFAELAITVTGRSVVRIEIVTPPAKREYLENTPFDPAGMEVRAYYDNGEEEMVSGWEYDRRPLQITDESVTIAFGGKSVKVAVSVSKKILTGITASGLPQKTSYIEGEYFDFLGAEVYAHYQNAPTEIIYGWDYDKKEPLKVTDSTVTIFFTLHGVTKTIAIPITVAAAPVRDPEHILADEVLRLLPSIQSLTVEDLPAIDYALSVLARLTNPTPEHIAKKAELEAKQQELMNSLPPEPEAEYTITYDIANGLVFSDISYGGNPATYKNSDGEVALSPAGSAEAAALGYRFKGWLIGGQPADKLSGLTADVTVYALFELTAKVNVKFVDAAAGAELYTIENVPRTDRFNFETEGITAAVYASHGVLPIAYYVNGTRVSSADLSIGAVVTVSVRTAAARELHLADSGSVTVGWKYAFTAGGSGDIAEKAPMTGTVFVVPVGAEVVLTSLNANISDILVDGVSKGANINNTVVEARFVLTAGEYAATVTFKTVITDITALSFIGQSQHSVVYPAGWDGYISAVDLERIAFFFDEANENYIAVYTIGGIDYYFEDLANYRFSGDTEIYVGRVRNSFAFTVFYDGGVEKIEGLRGKQTLQAAFSALSPEALATVNAIFKDGKLYTDSGMGAEVAAEALLSGDLRGDITVYSDWIRPVPPPPPPPDFGSVDYTGQSYVNTWHSLFTANGEVLSSELTLTADGSYSYRTFVNGVLSANAGGIYRIENGAVVLKTFILDYEYQIASAEDLAIDISFAADGLLRVNFIQLAGREKTLFEHTLVCGSVRPANYTGKDFLGAYEYNGARIELRANGTAVIEYGGETATVYYRVTKDGRLFVYENGTFGTGEIIGLIGGEL